MISTVLLCAALSWASTPSDRPEQADIPPQTEDLDAVPASSPRPVDEVVNVRLETAITQRLLSIETGHPRFALARFFAEWGAGAGVGLGLVGLATLLSLVPTTSAGSGGAWSFGFESFMWKVWNYTVFVLELVLVASVLPGSSLIPWVVHRRASETAKAGWAVLAGAAGFGVGLGLGVAIRGILSGALGSEMSFFWRAGWVDPVVIGVPAVLLTALAAAYVVELTDRSSWLVAAPSVAPIPGGLAIGVGGRL